MRSPKLHLVFAGMYLVLCRVSGALEILRLPDARVVFSCSDITEGHRLLHSSSAALPAPAEAPAAAASQGANQTVDGSSNPQRDLAEHSGMSHSTMMFSCHDHDAVMVGL